jgi:hypothetical protein
MRAPTVFAASLALATVAAAEPEVERPRFYFPKHIKRVVSNTTPASPVSPNRRDTPSGLSDFFAELSDGGDPFSLLNPSGSGLLPPVVVQPTPTKKSTHTTAKSSEKTTHTSAITFGPSGIVSSAKQPAVTSATSSDSGLLGGLLPGIFGGGTGASSTTKPEATSASSSSGGGGLLGGLSLTLPPLLPSATPAPTGTGATTSSEPGGLLSGILGPPPASTTDSSTGLGSILSSIIGTPTITGPSSAPTNGTATGTGTGFPTTTGSNSTTLPVTTPATNGTVSTTSLFSSSPTSGFTGSSNGTATITKPSSLPPVTTTSSTLSVPTSKAPESIMPIGTNTATSWLPNSVIVASSTSLVTGAQSTATGTPKVPQVISPPTGPAPGAPPGSTQIQIGFLFPLNYQFVVSNAVSSAQIYEWLPRGVAHGLGIKESDVVIQSLVPLDTTERLGYVTTIAMGYIPGSLFNTLNLDLHIPTSALYQNPDESVNTLMNYIDPSIPLTPGLGLPGSDSTGTGAAPTTEPNTGILDTAPQQKQTNSAMKSTAGIATGVVGAAAAYGAAMFFIARRYKKRRQSHRRSSSTFGGPEMIQAGSPALVGGSPVNPFMSGGRDSPSDSGPDRSSRGSGSSGSNSARTQQISGPMMAENSLGWN